jgi:hypothetical protein
MGRPIGYDGAVGLNAVRQEVMRSRSFATVRAGLVRADRRTGDFAGYSSKDQISFKSETAFTYGLSATMNAANPDFILDAPRPETFRPDGPLSRWRARGKTFIFSVPV